MNYHETITYYYKTLLILSNGDTILYDKTEDYPQPLEPNQKSKLLQDCVKTLQENEYVQFSDSVIFSSHVARIEIKMHQRYSY